MRDATAGEILQFLQEQSLKVYELLDVSPENGRISLPLLGPPRLKVSVKPGHKQNFTDRTLEIEVSGERVNVPLEVDDEFEMFRALAD